MKFSRAWSMPTADTLSASPIAHFAAPYLRASSVSVDPFARDSMLCTHRNDLNPATRAEYHLDAVAFCHLMAERGVVADLAIFDPPYSPRQITEVYASFGRKATTQDTQNAALYRNTRNALMAVLAQDAIVLSFGWNSAGMGIGRGFEIVEIMLCAHGGAHNDTICVAERRVTAPQIDMFDSMGAT